jgi:peptidoglycan hydrolase CwlO-like protein
MIDKDYVIYIILFSLISLGAYKSGVQKESFEKRIRNTEDMCLTLTVKKKQMEQRIEDLEYRLDSLYLHIK